MLGDVEHPQHHTIPRGYCVWTVCEGHDDDETRWTVTAERLGYPTSKASQKGEETLRGQRKAELENATAMLQIAHEDIEETGLPPTSDEELGELVHQLELEANKIKKLIRKEAKRPPTPYPGTEEHQQEEWFKCTRLHVC